MRLLFSDKVHFHKRNFKSLIEHVESNAKEVFFNEEHTDLIPLKGFYREHKEKLDEYFFKYNELPPNKLIKEKKNSINLYDICRAELLCFTSTQESFLSFKNNFNREEEFNWLYNNFKYDLVLNIAAAHFWIQFWERKLSALPVIHKAIVFSGSTIYTKSLLEIYKRKQGETYVAESFFTGNEYYLERKNTHTSNNSDLKFKTYLSSLKFDSLEEFERERIKAHNKIRTSKNKNVTQPNPDENEEVPHNNYLLIIGQVVNDFSILENKTGIRNTLSFYQDLIFNVLKNTQKDIVFKAHPWERKNVNLKKPKTFDYLMSWVDTLPGKYRSRILVTENYNLKKLLKKSSHVATICSQAALEAAYEGFKPIQFGNAFYGGHGFTHDYLDVECFTNDLSAEKINGVLSVPEFYDFELFITKALQRHLVSVHKSGHIRLREILKGSDCIKLIEKESPPPLPIPLSKPKEKIKTETKNKEIVNTEKDHKNNETKHLNKKRLKKLKENPHQYFKDSKHKYLRPLQLLFKKK